PSHHPPTAARYTLPLPDALPIYPSDHACRGTELAVARRDADLRLRAGEVEHDGRQQRRVCAVGAGVTPRADRLGEEVVDRLMPGDRKSTRLNSSHVKISYAVFCL